MEHLLCFVQVQRKKFPQDLYPLIADFLNNLFFKSKKLSSRTIEGYKTAIADFLRFHTKENFDENVLPQQNHKKFQVRITKTKECLSKVGLGYDPQLPQTTLI